MGLEGYLRTRLISFYFKPALDKKEPSVLWVAACINEAMYLQVGLGSSKYITNTTTEFIRDFWLIFDTHLSVLKNRLCAENKE